MAAVRSSGELIGNRVAIAAVLAATLIFLAPLYWIASTAFKPRNLATTVPPTVVFTDVRDGAATLVLDAPSGGQDDFMVAETSGSMANSKTGAVSTAATRSRRAMSVSSGSSACSPA